jgi:hypothetical protein
MPNLGKLKQNKEVVGSAQRLFHYCQLQDKTFGDISRWILHLSRHVKIFISSAIYRGNPKEVLQNPDWETPH